MNRRKLITSALGLIAAPRLTASTDLTFRLAVDNDNAPMSERVNGVWQGYFIDFTKHIIRDIEHNQIEYMPDLMWNRMLKAVEYGRVSLCYRVSYRQYRTHFMDYIGATGVQPKYLIIAEDNPVKSINTFDDLANISPPIMIDGSMAYQPEFDRLIKEDLDFRAKFNIENWFTTAESDPAKQFIRLISAGREGGFIINEKGARKYVEKASEMAKDNKSIVRLKALKVNCFSDEITYLCASRKIPQQYRDQMKINYAQSRKDGSFDEIWSKWWPDAPPPENILPGTK